MGVPTSIDSINDEPLEAAGATPWWMTRNYAPIDDEATIESLEVIGQIPEGLNGAYLRNGFNPPGAVPFHWFFGTGMIHGFEFENGSVSYRNRYVRTPFFEQDMDIFTAMSDLSFSPANTNIVGHAGRLLALEEAHLPWVVDRGLNTIGPLDFDGRLTTPMTAHPKVCPVTGEMMFFGYQFLSEPYLTYHRVTAAGELVQSEAIDIPRPVMMHDFAITRNYSLFFDLPIVFSAQGGGFHFDRDAGGRVGVLKRDAAGDTVRWFDVGPCTVFHSLNAYETGNEIVVHVCRAESLMETGMGDFGDQSTLWQWRFNLITGAATTTQIDDRTGDFPRIDDRLIGLEARFGYMAGMVAGTAAPEFSNELIKYDLTTGGAEVHTLPGEAAHAFEPVFVPGSAGSGEDDGFVIALSHDDATDQTVLNVIAAQDFSGDAVARVVLPRRVPFGAHGNWFSN